MNFKKSSKSKFGAKFVATITDFGEFFKNPTQDLFIVYTSAFMLGNLLISLQEKYE